MSFISVLNLENQHNNRCYILLYSIDTMLCDQILKVEYST